LQPIKRKHVIQKQSYRQPPIRMYNTQQQMENVMNSPYLTPDEKSTLYSNELNRLQVFQNKLSSRLQAQDRLQIIFRIC
jgi:hypothetical protein